MATTRTPSAPAAEAPAPAAATLAAAPMLTINNAPVALRDPRGPMPMANGMTRTTPATGPLIVGIVVTPWTAEDPPRYNLNQRALVAPGGSGANGIQPSGAPKAPLTLTVLANGTSGAQAVVGGAVVGQAGSAGSGMTVTTTVVGGVVTDAVVVSPGNSQYRVGEVVRLLEPNAGGPILLKVAS